MGGVHRRRSVLVVLTDDPVGGLFGRFAVLQFDDVYAVGQFQFARDNGIRRPDAIIRDVAASLKQFLTIASKCGVSEEWMGRVEATIISHLKSWGE